MSGLTRRVLGWWIAKRTSFINLCRLMQFVKIVLEALKEKIPALEVIKGRVLEVEDG